MEAVLSLPREVVVRSKVASIGILILDSNQTQRRLLAGALKRRPEFQVTTCDLDIEVALELLASESISIVLVNTSRAGAPDMSLLRRLHLARADVNTILLLDRYDRDLVLSAFRAGARGLFSFSDQPIRLLCKCIHCVHQGEVWANSEQLQHLLTSVAQVPSLRVVNSNGLKLLTLREEQVVALVADGLSNREIAGELRLSEHTIKKYVFRIFDKLGISSRVELVLYAVNHGGQLHAEWLPSRAVAAGKSN